VGPEIKSRKAQLGEAGALSVNKRSFVANRLQETKRLDMAASDSMLKEKRVRPRPSRGIVKLQAVQIK
jgi:hypothetical protein